MATTCQKSSLRVNYGFFSIHKDKKVEKLSIYEIILNKNKEFEKIFSQVNINN